MPLLRLAIWRHIWKRIVEKSQTNAANVTFPFLRQAIWRDIWQNYMERICNIILSPCWNIIFMPRKMIFDILYCKLTWHLILPLNSVGLGWQWTASVWTTDMPCSRIKKTLFIFESKVFTWTSCKNLVIGNFSFLRTNDDSDD